MTRPCTTARNHFNHLAHFGQLGYTLSLMPDDSGIGSLKDIGICVVCYRLVLLIKQCH